jgi:hypothetical protein
VTGDDDLARRLLEYPTAAPVPSDLSVSGWTHMTPRTHPTLAEGKLTFRWEVRLVDGTPTLATSLSCDPGLEQADIVAMLRREADSHDFEPDLSEEPTHDET